MIRTLMDWWMLAGPLAGLSIIVVGIVVVVYVYIKDRRS